MILLKLQTPESFFCTIPFRNDISLHFILEIINFHKLNWYYCHVQFFRKIILFTINLILCEALCVSLVEIEEIHFFIFLSRQRGNLSGGPGVDSGIPHVGVLLPHQCLFFCRPYREIWSSLVITMGHCNWNIR